MIFGLWSGSRSQVGSGKQGETMAAHLKKPEKELIAEKEAPSGFLATIERVGNMVPHPAIIFFILIGIVIVLSVIFGLLGTTVTFDGYDPAISDIVEQTASVRSLLSPDGIRFMLTSPVSNFLGFTGVGVILVAMIGVGLAEESGLIATLVRKLVAIAPRSIFTFMIVMVGVLSSIAADAGYLVLVPLAAAAFHSLGRHPLAGLAAGFSGVAAVFLVNVFITPTDALLVEVTNDAIRAVNPAAQISVVGNLFFMIVSSILMGIICTVLTERFVEPRLGPYTGGVPVEAATGLSGSEQLGLKYAGRALLGFVVVIGLLTAPPLPWGILRNQETGGIMAGSPFMSGLIILISLLFLVVGFAYGKGAGTIANVTAAIGLIVKTWSNLAGMIFLLFVIANFIAFFNYTNLATVLAVNLAEFLQTVPIGMTGYIVIFVIVVAMIDIILAGALAKWAILAPVFVPLFMQLGRRSELGACGLPGWRQPDERHHAAERLSGGDGRLRAEVSEGCRHRHDRGADAALHRHAFGALDADAGCVVRLRHPAGTGITAKVAFVRGMKLEACETVAKPTGMTHRSPFRYFRTSPEIIRLAVMMYVRFPRMRGEARSPELTFAAKIAEAYASTFEEAKQAVKATDGATADVKFTHIKAYPPFHLADDAPVVRRAATALQALGIKPNLMFSPGGLDANWLDKHGIPTVTVGAGQREVHTVKEYVELDEYVTGCKIAVLAATQKG